MKKINLFFQIRKNEQVQLMSFYYINAETIGKMENDFFFFKPEIFLQVQLTNFCHTNTETKTLHFFFLNLNYFLRNCAFVHLSTPSHVTETHYM